VQKLTNLHSYFHIYTLHGYLSILIKICRGQPRVGSSPTSATIYAASHSESISTHNFLARRLPE
jgi:hypothetical protein